MYVCMYIYIYRVHPTRVRIRVNPSCSPAQRPLAPARRWKRRSTIYTYIHVYMCMRIYVYTCI